MTERPTMFEDTMELFDIITSICLLVSGSLIFLGLYDPSGQTVDALIFCIAAKAIRFQS
jgi:hypothetical protein